jgi:proteic killer suppression protein
VILGFGDKATEDFFHGTSSKDARTIPADIASVVHRKLDMVNFAKNLGDLRIPPANHLKALAGNLAGCYSIRVNNQYRIVFRWLEGAFDVRFTDYH